MPEWWRDREMEMEENVFCFVLGVFWIIEPSMWNITACCKQGTCITHYVPDCKSFHWVNILFNCLLLIFWSFFSLILRDLIFFLFFIFFFFCISCALVVARHSEILSNRALLTCRLTLLHLINYISNPNPNPFKHLFSSHAKVEWAQFSIRSFHYLAMLNWISRFSLLMSG